MRFTPGPLRAAAMLAVGFVAVRVVYRIVFHGADSTGADSTGAVLWALPEVRLPAPFAHVVLFGQVTADGLAAAALSALPIALVILAFGVLNSTVDLSRLFARAARTGPFQGIGRALAIAWATLPSLADAVRSVRVAQQLRGERPGVAMLSPVLERTLDRATAVAAALELRGYAGRGLAGECERPVEVRDAVLGFAEPVLVDALVLQAGELTVITGPTGSGKSTLLRALSGLLGHVDGGGVTGDVLVVGLDRAAVPPRDTARTVGVVLQHPREAFATERVADEIGLALELRGVARVVRDARVHEVAERVGVTALLDRPVRGLSAGEATLVAIAAAIVERPILLLVDEPLADLDASARARIVALLGMLAHEAGMCVVVAEHRADALAAVEDRRLEVRDGRLRPLAADGGGTADAHDPAPRMRRVGGGAALGAGAGSLVLSATNLTVRHGEILAVDDADLELHAGEIAVLSGPNGAGKSSLLMAMARPRRGDAVQITGAAPDAAAIALVPDASDDLFLHDTVAAECRRADRRAVRGTSRRSVPRKRSSATAARFAGLLDLDPTGGAFARLLARHPRDLSAGQRRCLAIAIQTAGSPRVLLIDEPTRGLDPRARDLVARALIEQADAGVAVLIATHDAALAASIGDRLLSIDGGRVSTAAARSARSADSAAPSSAARTPRPRPAPSGSTTIPATTPQHHRSLAPTAALARRIPWREVALIAATLVAIAAFAWPLVTEAVPTQAQAAVPVLALALAPIAIIVVLASLDATVRSAHTIALLAVLVALGAAIRMASTGVGGVEALFILLILAGRAFGARFGLLLGAACIALSAVLWGGVGPWLPFQMFACGWVAAGAGLLPKRIRGWAEIVMLCAYGVLASYAFGLIMNLWFWPFAVGADTSISYIAGGPLSENLARFVLYSLLTSTAGWDTLRAVTTLIGLLVVGRPLLAALRRAKPMLPTPMTPKLLVPVRSVR